MRRIPFGLQLFATLALTLVISGGFAMLVSRPGARDALLDEALDRHGADAEAIQRAESGHAEGEDTEGEAYEVLAALAQRPGTIHSAVLGPEGQVVASTRAPGTRDSLTETKQSDADIRAAFAGMSRVHIVSHEGRDQLSLTSPLTLDGRPHVLHTELWTDELARAMSRSERQSLLALLVGILAAVPLFFVFGGRRITRAHRTALHRADRDGLTDLPNHRAFQTEIEQAVEEADDTGRPLALAMLDIDDFKIANDRLGHRYGDTLLKHVAATTASLRGTDGAFRLGGDEFAVILCETDTQGAEAAMERLRRDLADRTQSTTVSIGLALHTSGQSHESLWEAADNALYEAKRSGGNRIHRISTEADVTSGGDERRALADLLESELAVALQPIVRMKDDNPLGYEALARPQVGFTNPGEAFEAAERHGKARELDTLCRAAALELAGDLPPGTLLFLNVSPHTLDGGSPLIEEVAAIGLDPSQIVLEITEQSTARLDRVVEEARRLRDHGFKLALDDVGAGNAGLEMLRQLTVDFVKVDRGVVRGAMDSHGARGVLAAILAFAQQSGAAVIAEGIEDESMLDFVRGLGTERFTQRPRVHAAQGFHLGRPEVGLDLLQHSHA